MNHITLAWMQNGERVMRTLEVGDETIQPGVFRIGRDPDQCDVVMPSTTERERTVSRCHVEISFDADRFGFYLTNLKANNPPYIKGEPVTDSVKLTKGCTFELGEVELLVEDVSAAVPETIIIQRPRQVPPQGQVTILSERSDAGGKPLAAREASQPEDPDSTIYPDAYETPGPEDDIESSEPQSSHGPVVVSPAPELPNPPSSPAGSIFDRVKDQLFSCPKGHKYTLAEAKELGWICKYDGYLITSTFVAK